MTPGMLLAAGLAHAGGFGLDRVDVLAAAPSSFLWMEVRRFGARPGLVSLRFAEQVSVGWRLPADGFQLGTSIAVQELRYARPFREDGRLGWVAGVPTRLGLPVGARGGLTWTAGRAHLEAGPILQTSASWARPSWQVRGPFFALGVGILLGPQREGSAGG